MRILPWTSIGALLCACASEPTDSPKPNHSGDSNDSAQTTPPGDLDTSENCPFDAIEEVALEPLPGQLGRVETHASGGFTDDYLYDDTEYVKIGVRQDWGGSVVFFGLADGSIGPNTTNTVDANDPGREVQFAIYDPDRLMQGCAHDASCRSGGTSCGTSIRYLGWNPVQGGNRCGDGSGVETVHHADGILHTETRPLHWNPDWDSTDCATDSCNTSASARKSDVLVTQKARFVRTHVVELSYTVENLSALDHAAQVQEMPTLYSANGDAGPDLWRLLDANGTQIEIDKPANDGFFYTTFSSPESWVSLQNETLDYGVGLLYENGLLEFQGWQNRSMPFNNVRALFNFGLGAHQSVEARAYLILGGFSTVQAEAEWLQKNLAPFGRIESPEALVDSDEIQITGWAQDNRSVVKVEAVVDEWLTIPLDYGVERSDICGRWPGYPSCSAVGFEGRFSVDQLGWTKGCAHQVEIRAEDSDGNIRIIDRRTWAF